MFRRRIDETLCEFSLRVAADAPLFPAAIGIVAGIVVDRAHPLPLTMYVLGFALSSILITACSLRLRLGPVLVVIASIALGGALHAVRVRVIEPTSIAHLAPENGVIVRLKGSVASAPQYLEKPPNPFARWTYGQDRTAFILKLDTVYGTSGEIAATGKVRITVNEVVINLREGDRVEVFGWLYALRPPQNPGAFDWAQMMRDQGVVATMRVDHREAVRLLQRPPPNRLAQLQQNLRAKLRGWLVSDLAASADHDTGFMEALILGHRSRLDAKLNDAFIRSGCSHFLAASGINVVMVMWLVAAPLRLFGVRRRLAAWAMLLAVIMYMLITEPRPPILRAGFIGTVYCIAVLLDRENARLNWISLTIVVLAIFDPAMVFDVGYQLSTAAVFGVAFLSPALIEAADCFRRWFVRYFIRRNFFFDDAELKRLTRPVDPASFPARISSRLWSWSRNGVSVSLAAWLVGVPLVGTTFFRFQPLGAINSLLIAPLMAFLMALGFAKLCLSPFLPTLAEWIGLLSGYIETGIVKIIPFLANLRGSDVAIPSPAWWVTIVIYVALLGVILRFPRSKTDEETNDFRYRKPLRISFGVFWMGSMISVIAIVIWLVGARSSEGLSITFLAVGNGSATVINLPNGQSILYDAGASGPNDVGRNTIVPALRSMGIRSLDRVYISHPNLDHFSGVLTLLDSIPSGPIVLNRFFEHHSAHDSPARFLLDQIELRNHPIEQVNGDVKERRMEDVRFEFLAPLEMQTPAASNDASTVLRISYHGYSILLTGDIEEFGQAALLERGDLHADVLVMPHHGGIRSNTSEFIRAVDPKVVIRSSGERTDESIYNMQGIVGNVPMFNTADVGAVRVVIGKCGLRVGGMHAAELQFVNP